MDRASTGLLAGLVMAAVWAAGLQAAAQSQPDMSFGYGLDNDGKIRQVIVYRDKQQIQTLDVCTAEDVPRQKKLGELEREDFNFDGYPDLMMQVASEPQTENSSYCIWLYDPKTQTFVLSEELSDLINPQPDPNSHTVIARKQVRCAGGCYEQAIYKWSNGRLDPVREESLTEDPLVPPWSDCRWVLEVQKEKHGKLVETSRQRVDPGGVMCEPHAAW